MRIFIICVIFISFVFAAFFDPQHGAGTTIFPILKEETGAKSSALGGATSAWNKAPEGFLANPATMGFVTGQGVSLTYDYRWGLAHSICGAYVRPYGENNKFSVAISTISYGSFDKTDENANVIGEISAGDFVFSGGYAHKFGNNIWAGATLKFAYSTADEYSASAIMATLGATYSFGRGEHRVAFAAENIGTVLKSYGSDKPHLPIGAKLGGSFRMSGLPTRLFVQAGTYIDKPYDLRAGLEIDEFKPVFIRFGYALRSRGKEDPSKWEKMSGLSGGIGIEIEKFCFDYSIQSYGALGFMHKASIALVRF